tara:strand:+ start:833 stop:1120 length:288 start_codon:yes stop_codon:yes gene_type:complete
MATLAEHKAQVKLDKPSGTVKVNTNGVDSFLEGDAYDAWVDAVATSRLSDEQIGYKSDRAKEYPGIADQLDDIYHNGIDGWKATIKVTKDKYPKP